MTDAQTTVCLLTPPGKGGIAVIELAGPAAHSIIASTFKPQSSHALQAPENLQLGRMLAEDGQVLDEAIVETRDGRIHINIHGGPWVTQAVLDLLIRRGAKRLHAPAGPVFATCYAQWNNPAIGNEMLALLKGLQSPLAIAAVANQWSAGLSRLAAHALTALRQSSPPPDLPASLRRAAEGLAVARRLIEPAEVVLAGPPNAGKSTLANALAGLPMSIVHETPGTTRDWVRQLVLICGVPVWLTDTAGIWEITATSAAAAVDAEAVRRARQRLTHADLIVLLGQADAKLQDEVAAAGKGVLRVWSKSDILPAPAGLCDLAVSAQRGDGIEDFRRAILDRLGTANIDPASPMAFTDRQANLLTQSASAIDRGDHSAAANLLHKLLQG